ncbi:PKD domain-containing protein [Methanolobus mangrovi]|uniref:PKD domain-containing protein n=1 Tax=Methanolobus mangrovi TaxID=3072977 RepID=A0AA51YH82_9EURY|nr:PKD domain-containing protein [Methanolobus mangrovi]WMW22892.1 PKD domain-containing protein [Methanolobus mangrovi]
MFTIEVELLPVMPISGAQFSVYYPENGFSVLNVSEGDFFSRYDLSTVFELKNDTYDGTSSGTIYCAILGNHSVAESGTIAVLTMGAGNYTGYLTIDLEDVILSDASSSPVNYIVNNATILVDSKPELVDIGTVQVTEGNLLNLTLKATDADNDVLVFSVNSLPDGATLSNSSGSLMWLPNTNQVGEHSLELSVTDGYLTDTKSAVIEVLPSDLSPIAHANGPYEVRTAKKLRFSSTGSYDPDGTIMSYTWDFGDGNVGIGPSPFYTYNKAGVYTLTLTITDDAGNIGIDKTTVTVENIFKFYLDKFNY